ncbi:MAG TPA: glycosyltransferase family 39 protein, partial [Chthoniobacterales bacterium]|nr:glycosyltransferase family 39 protein [Chthoniobacterales bacterium]
MTDSTREVGDDAPNWRVAAGQRRSSGSAAVRAPLLRLFRQWPRAFLSVAVVLSLLPFTGKAFHIDDPLFVWAGQHIRTQPLNPYGFEINWYGTAMPMAEVTKNPPLTSYYIAVVTAVCGEGAMALHVAFILLAAASVLGTYRLALRLCRSPLAAAVAVLFTPVFLISSTTVMSDVVMLAFWVWAIVLWLEGIERRSGRRLAVAALLVAVCTLSKYFGAALIPLLLAYSIAKERRPRPSLLFLLIPLAIFGWYEWATHSLYGHGLLSDAFRYANEERAAGWESIGLKVSGALAFLGGCFAVVLTFVPLLYRPRVWLTGAIITVGLAIGCRYFLGMMPSYKEHPFLALFSAQMAIMITGGAVIAALMAADLKQHANAESLLLCLIVAGTFAFALLNWTVNGRSLLPAGPAIAILLWRRIEAREAQRRLAAVAVAFACAAAISFAAAFADYRLANSARTAAIQIARDYAHPATKTVWFQGHWGFQYYATAAGLAALDVKHSRIVPGDLMIMPLNNTNLFELESVDLVANVELQPLRWLTTMSVRTGAGFYSDA